MKFYQLAGVVVASFVLSLTVSNAAFACDEHDGAPSADQLDQKAEVLKKAADCVRNGTTDEAKKECMAPIRAMHSEKGDCKKHGKNCAGKKCKEKKCNGKKCAH